MCQHILQKNQTEPNWLDNLWTSDEANFNLNGNHNIYFCTYYYVFICRTCKYKECAVLCPQKRWKA